MDLEFYLNYLIEILKNLTPEHWLLLCSLLANLLFSITKLKGSKLEKAYKKALKSSVAEDYVLEVNGIYYSLKNVHFVKKEDVEKEVIHNA